MSVADRVRGRAREDPKLVTAVLSVAGYALVFGTFGGVIPYPEIPRSTVNLLSHAIAVVNSAATICLIAGWRWIRRDEVRKHRLAMGSAFVLILVFLSLYLVKVGGGGEKEIVGATGLVYWLYIAMLAVHIVLSAISVPVVLHALVLGLTHTPAELRSETPHRTVGRVAAGVWILSLTLGVVTYVMLNWIYEYRFMMLPPM